MELYWTLLAWKELNLRIWEISQACLKTYSTEDGMWNHYTTTKSSISLGGCFISRKTTTLNLLALAKQQITNYHWVSELYRWQTYRCFKGFIWSFEPVDFLLQLPESQTSIWELFQCPLKNIISGHKFHGLRNPFLRNIASMPILASRNHKLFQT